MKRRIFLPTIMVMVSLLWLKEAWGVKPPPITNALPKSVLELSLPPASWGKPIPGSMGRFIYYDNSPRILKGEIQLSNLQPNHSYVLTLNGKPEHPSNQHLPAQSSEKERYFDFKQVHTDKNGYLKIKLELTLSPGEYDVKFFVKDPTDWKIVLYNDFFVFTVK